LFILAALLLPVAAKADNVAWQFTSVTGTSSLANDNFGVVFKPTANIIVDELGYYDPPGGMLYSHEVGIYNSTGTLLTSANVATYLGATLTDGFYYTSITPIELYAGQTYVLDGFTSGVNVSDISGADKYSVITSGNVGPDGFAVSLPITILGDSTISGTHLADTGTAYATQNDYFGADFEGYATPEPSSLLLLGSGLAGLAGLLKRKLTA
jgi:hypothetical protein